MPDWPVVSVRQPSLPARNRAGKMVFPELRSVPDNGGFIVALAEGIDRVIVGESAAEALELWDDYVIGLRQGPAHSHQEGPA